MTNITERKNRKRDLLTKEENRALHKYVRSFPSVVDCAFVIGIHRNVLDLVMIRGSGSPETIRLIKEKLNSVELLGKVNVQQ